MNPKRSLLFVSLLLFLGQAFPLFAQLNAPVIRGIVQDAATGTPLRGVSVEAVNALYGAISNNAGEFVLQVNAAQAMSIHFSRIGYQDTEVVVSPEVEPAVVRLSPERKASAQAQVAQASVVTEATLRLNLIRKLISLTTWKDQAARKNRVLTIALIGHNPFGDDLYAFEDITLNNRSIAVEFLQSPEEVTDQDVLIVSRANATLIQELNTRLEGKSMLVICNECGENVLAFASISLIREGDAIHYSVNKYAPKLMGITLAPIVYELSTKP